MIWVENAEMLVVGRTAHAEGQLLFCLFGPFRG